MSMSTSEGGKYAKVVGECLLSGFQISVGRRAIREDTWRLRKANAVVKLLVLALTAFGQRSLNLTTPGGSSENGWLTHPAYAGSCNTASKRPKREE
jgi:hypothetical protein